MRLYNTLTRSEEDFVPADGRTVRMYSCGLTVYARGHIGNFRSFVAQDVLRRALFEWLASSERWSRDHGLGSQRGAAPKGARDASAE